MFRDIKKIKETNTFVEYEYKNIDDSAKGIIRFNKKRHNAQILKRLPKETEGQQKFFVIHIGPLIEENNYPDNYKLRIT
jgi:hypothetical protein